MQLSLLPRTLLFLAIFVLQGACSMFLVRPLFFHHDNFQQNPVISGWRGSSSILDLAQQSKVVPSPDLPDSFSPTRKRQFPLVHRWKYSRYPF